MPLRAFPQLSLSRRTFPLRDRLRSLQTASESALYFDWLRARGRGEVRGPAHQLMGVEIRPLSFDVHVFGSGTYRGGGPWRPVNIGSEKE
jgi:hypothetical protein